MATALLFTIGKTLIGLYIGSTAVASGYGAAGALIVVLLWIYFSAQIFLLGAEFTKAYARTNGSRCGAPPPPLPAASTTARRSGPGTSLRLFLMSLALAAQRRPRRDSGSGQGR